MAEDSVNNVSDEKRKQFGNRFLTDPRNVFEHNAWDNVVWDEEQEREARSKIQEQLAYIASEGDIAKFEEDANEFWNKFYGKHENKFFKDRHWLFTEFPELSPEYYLPSEKLAQLSTGSLAQSSDSKDPGFSESVQDNCSKGCKVLAERSIKGTDGTSANKVLLPSPDDVKKSSLKEASQRHLQPPSDTSVKNSKEDIGAEQLQPTHCAGNQICCPVETIHSGDKVTRKSGDFNAVLDCDNSQCSNLNASGENILTQDNNDSCTRQVFGQSDNKVKHMETFPGESAKYRIFEVGCGVGNTVFPILQANNDPGLKVYCCDYSSTAIELVKENKDYDSQRCYAFVCDISDPAAAVPFPEGSLDVIVMIFILSANNPDKFQYILNRLASFLRPGGIILFRDYGRYDLAQLRFKKGKCLGENFYVRGDGTRVYFFTQDELRDMMTKAGLEEKQNLVDRRLQVNRGRQLKMYRVWIQCKYRKPTDSDQNLTENGKITTTNS